MIDLDRLNPVLKGYKEYFPTHWEDEKYKWEAVKHFQEHWNINAPDFGAMFDEATDYSKTDNLLTSRNFLPRNMIIDMANADDDAVREMFIELFDESRDLESRITAFQASAEKLRSKYDDGTWQNHFQNTNAISTYLWLRYPDKYYIYKYSEYKSVAQELRADYVLKRDGKAANVIEGKKLYDEIRRAILADTDLCSMIKEAITPSCYQDSQMITATIDVGFFLKRYYIDEKQWWPKEYTPNISCEEWVSLLNDSNVFTTDSLTIIRRMKDIGGKATCKELSKEFGENPNYYNSGSSALAKRVAKKTGCKPFIDTDGSVRWWPILYLGKQADSDEEGVYSWRLRDELSDAFDRVDLFEAATPLDDETTVADCHYWWLNASPKIWSFSDLMVGEEQSYTFYTDSGHKRRVFKNFQSIKVGDLVIGYEATPVKKITALLKVSKVEKNHYVTFEKLEELVNPIEYSILKDSPELSGMEAFQQPNGSLFKLTESEYYYILDLVRDLNPLAKGGSKDRYTKEDFLKKVFMTPQQYDTLTALLNNKLNVILQGPPGVGKTFAARRLAYAMMGEKDDERVKLVQFHQSYSYEDFVMGYRPDGEGFQLVEGIFYRFCRKAANDPNRDYFFIIDEINRGNLSRIFGELLMLIEKEYRENTEVTLAYTGKAFTVPKNMFIIGMMNTADRSLAMIDYALRRRFSFFGMEPGFGTNGFIDYQKKLQNKSFDTLIETIKHLNDAIASDSALGKGFQIGHSYFCNKEKHECTTEWMSSVVNYDIIPTLQEYWFDKESEVEKWARALNGALND